MRFKVGQVYKDGNDIKGIVTKVTKKYVHLVSENNKKILKKPIEEINHGVETGHIKLVVKDTFERLKGLNEKAKLVRHK